VRGDRLCLSPLCGNVGRTLEYLTTPGKTPASLLNLPGVPNSPDKGVLLSH